MTVKVGHIKGMTDDQIAAVEESYLKGLVELEKKYIERTRKLMIAAYVLTR